MIKYAKGYIDRLLFATEPNIALNELSSVWTRRSEVTEAKEFFGLAEAEFHVHIYLLYEGDVGNGGHAQFFFNPAGRYAPAVTRALAALQFRETADIFRRACAVFPNGIVPAEDDERRHLIQQLPGGALELWAALNREFYAVNMAYRPQLLAYLRERDTEIFQQERT